MITIEEIKSKTTQNFWSKIKFGNPDECWEWQGGLTSKIPKKGYGAFHIPLMKGSIATAHRWLYVKLFGEIDKHIDVCHTCDNRKCCNPTHLWAGTRKQNIQDMWSKNRQSAPPLLIGEKHPSSKLTEEKVRLIKMKIANGKHQREIAKEFGVGQRTICAINVGFAWKHVI